MRHLTKAFALAVFGLFAGAVLRGNVAGRPLVATSEVKGPVWAIGKTSDGTLIVGADALQAFDGSTWTKIEVPGGYAFRGVAIGKSDLPGTDRVWVGGIGAIGFAERRDGKWSYTSLLPELGAAGAGDIRDVWSVHAVGDGAVWVASDRVFRWTPQPHADGDGTFEVWNLPATPRLVGFSDGDGVLIYQGAVGILRLDEKGPPIRVVPLEALPEQGLTWVVSGKKADGKAGDYFVGLGDGAYRWDGKEGFRRIDELSAALAGSLPTDAVRLDDRRIAVSTYKKGIVVADDEGKVLGEIEGKDGLSDDNVNGLWAHGGHLWAALQNGMARIDGVGTAERFDRESGFGTELPVKIIESSGERFVLTNKSLYRVGTHTLEPVLKGEALLRDAVVGKDVVWIGGLGGVWRHEISTGKTSHVHQVSADIFGMIVPSHLPDTLLFLENYTPRLLYPSPSYGWGAYDAGPVVGDTPLSVYSGKELRDDVWVSMIAGGIDRFRWDEVSGDPALLPQTADENRRRPMLRSRAEYTAGRGLPEKVGHPVLVPLGGRLFAFTDQGILLLSEDGGKFAEAAGLEEFIGVAGVEGDGQDGFWVVEPRALGSLGVPSLVRVRIGKTGQISWEGLEAPGIRAVGSVSSVSRTLAGGSSLWFAGSQGLARLNEEAVEPAPAPASLTVGEPKHEGTGLRFEFPASIAATGEPVFFETRLVGADGEWSPPSPNPTRILTGLGYGKYRFEARLVDRFGRTGPASGYEFRIPTPWYATQLAVLGYVLIAALAIVGGVRWRLGQLHRQNERLNQIVAERTKELELSNTAKNEFLENISHELRNPLNGLLGMVGRLKTDVLGQEDQNAVRLLRASAKQMGRAFEDVLGFSKLEYGNVTVERTPFRLREILGEAIELHGTDAAERGCTVKLKWPEGEKDGFLGDPAKIRTVVSNFLGNAIKYAPGKGIAVGVGILPEENSEAGGAAAGMVTLLIEVADQGPGIPVDEQELIFKKFVRGSNTRKSQVAGSGLGLATCQVLARLMNGNIGLESTPGEGATFYLRLLLPRAEVPAASADAALPIAEGIPALIVEDEEYNQAVLEGIALELGLKPEIAADSEEAKAMLSKQEFSVLFLDWELPGAKGGDIARQVRKAGNGRSPIILASTAHDSDEIREKCREAGMDGFLLKPYNVETVKRALAEVAVKRGNGAPAFVVGRNKDSISENEAFQHYARARPEDAKGGPQRWRKALETEAVRFEKALNETDEAAMALSAHRLRSLSGLVGAQELNRAAGKLENAARSGTPEERRSQWEIVRPQCAALLGKLA